MAKLEELTLKRMLETNGGYELPEVVVYGHQKTWWESLTEGIQSIDWYSMYLNRF